MLREALAQKDNALDQVSLRLGAADERVRAQQRELEMQQRHVASAESDLGALAQRANALETQLEEARRAELNVARDLEQTLQLRALLEDRVRALERENADLMQVYRAACAEADVVRGERDTIAQQHEAHQGDMRRVNEQLQSVALDLALVDEECAKLRTQVNFDHRFPSSLA